MGARRWPRRASAARQARTRSCSLICAGPGAFGLATDYAVSLLTRIKEARDAGASERDAVAIGLERTGRIVTQAPMMFCVAIGAFATSSVIFIKEVGVGMLVPALIALLGARNWWAPGRLRRLHNTIGLGEG